MTRKWRVQGQAIGGCNCDQGCPCNFNAPPTYGSCTGVYAFHIESGHVNGTRLDGLSIAQPSSYPRAIHLGNGTTYNFIDAKASPDQREALTQLLTGELGGPLGIFASLTTTWLGPDVGPIEWTFAGSQTAVRCGTTIEMQLAPIKNPVTAVVSGFTLLMTNGLLTNRSELMATSVLRVTHPGLHFDHSGHYGELFRFDWSGEA
jgi:hypothetical protein